MDTNQKGPEDYLIPEGTQIPFTVSEKPIPAYKLRQLIRAAGHMGLRTDFELPVEITTNELMERHLAATMPISRDDYIGKEHLVAIGERQSLQSNMVGSIFSSLVFPRNKRRNGSMWMDPESIGLVVKHRQELGYEKIPAVKPAPFTNGHPRQNGQYANPPRRNYTPISDEIIIQVGSFIDLTKKPDVLGRLYNISVKRVMNLHEMGVEFERMVTPPLRNISTRNY